MLKKKYAVNMDAIDATKVKSQRVIVLKSHGGMVIGNTTTRRTTSKRLFRVLLSVYPVLRHSS